MRKTSNYEEFETEIGVLKEESQVQLLQDILGSNNTNSMEIPRRISFEASGKLVLIDKYLPKLISDDHKVLIFFTNGSRFGFLKIILITEISNTNTSTRQRPSSCD